jgi:hypothetical protein
MPSYKHPEACVRYEVFTVVTMKNGKFLSAAVSWLITLYSLGSLMV